MTTPEERAAALDMARQLNESMEGLRGDITVLRTYGQHNRRMLWGVIASLVLAVLALIAVAVVALQAADATSTANQNRQAAVTTCNASNQARAVSTQLWSYVLSVIEQNARQSGTFTPQVEKQLTDFRSYIATSYAPRDCTQVGGN